MKISNYELTEEIKNYYIYSNYNSFFLPPNENYNQEDFINDSIGYNDNNDNNLNNKNEIKTREKTYQNKGDKEKLMSNINDIINNSFVSLNNKNNLEIPNINTKKRSGRKRIRSKNNKSEHNKYSDDNIRRRCKHFVLNSLLEFINKQINKLYNGNIGNGIFKKELQTINQSQKSDASIDFNKLFLEKKIGDIFSDTISGKYTNFPTNYNKLLIEKLRNEADEYKRIYFNKLFDLSFIECLKHFRGEKNINELEGLKCFNDIKDHIIEKYPIDGKEYITYLEYYMNNFETIINNKRSRRPRKLKI